MAQMGNSWTVPKLKSYLAILRCWKTLSQVYFKCTKMRSKLSWLTRAELLALVFLFHCLEWSFVLRCISLRKTEFKDSTYYDSTFYTSNKHPHLQCWSISPQVALLLSWQHWHPHIPGYRPSIYMRVSLDCSVIVYPQSGLYKNKHCHVPQDISLPTIFKKTLYNTS